MKRQALRCQDFDPKHNRFVSFHKVRSFFRDCVTGFPFLSIPWRLQYPSPGTCELALIQHHALQKENQDVSGSAWEVQPILKMLLRTASKLCQLSAAI